MKFLQSISWILLSLDTFIRTSEFLFKMSLRRQAKLLRVDLLMNATYSWMALRFNEWRLMLPYDSNFQAES